LLASAPCILFLDQIEILAQARSKDSPSSMGRLLNCLLSEMDGIGSGGKSNIIVIAATTHMNLLDPAIMRPGRLDTHLYVGPPNVKERSQILEVYTKNMSCGRDVDGQFINVLAENTNHYSGADLASLCREAGLLCMRENIENSEVCAKHFLEAKDHLQPSLI